MRYTIRPCLLLFVLVGTFSALVLALPTLVHAETKTIISDAAFIMGDGETPFFAEAMALQTGDLLTATSSAAGRSSECLRH